MEGKYDLTGRAHDQVIPKPGGLIERSLINLSGIPADFAYRYGSSQERSDLKALGAVLLGSSAFTSVTATAGFHLTLGDGGFHPLYAIAGIGIGALQGVIDLVVQYKGTAHSKGIAELSRVGLKLTDGGRTSSVYRLIRVGRAAQSATFGFLGGLFFVLAANGSDINAYIHNRFMADNPVIAAEMTKLVDAGIARSRDALSLEAAEVNNISQSIRSLRTHDVRRDTSPRRRTDATSAVPDAALAALEQRLAQETTKRDALAAQVSSEEGSRNAKIDKAILDSPHAIRMRTGLGARLEALGALTEADIKLLIVTIAIEFISLALELGPLWCSLVFIPSALAAQLALDHFTKVSELARAGAEKLGATAIDNHDSEEPGGRAFNENDMPTISPEEMSKDANVGVPAASGLNGAIPQRRGPGRPKGSVTRRQNGQDFTAEEAGHE